MKFSSTSSSSRPN